MKISVIVPVRNVEDFLEQCLNSIERVDNDVEIIVVDDRSTDTSLAIAKEAAKRDERIKLEPLPNNVGLGQARNHGLEAACGDYVMFLDSDDYLVPGALTSIVNAVRSSRADIVIFDYQRVHNNGKVERNLLGEKLLSNPDERTITLSERPALLDNLNVAWNKAYRRSFLTQNRLNFPTGWYEDIPFTYQALCLAKSIYLLDKVCVAYRQREGSILRSKSVRHTEFVDQLHRLFTAVEARPQLEKWRSAIWNRGLVHTWALLMAPPGRLSRQDALKLHRQATLVLKEHQPPGHHVTDLRHWALLLNSYPLLILIRVIRDSLGNLRIAVTQIAETVRRRLWLSKTVRFIYFQFHRMLPIERGVAVFYSLWGRAPSGNPLAIAEAASKHLPGIRVVYLLGPANMGCSSGQLDKLEINSREYFRLLARAEYFVSDVNFPNWWRPRRDQIFLQTQHGTPLKTMGEHLNRLPHATRKPGGKLRKRVRTWTYNLSSNPYSTRIWSESMPGRYETLEYGYPRNDYLVLASAGDTTQAKAELQIEPGIETGLYMPTWRDLPLNESNCSPDEIMGALAKLSVNWLIRWHYFDADSVGNAARLPGPFPLTDVTHHEDLNTLFLASDFLLTDYSSAMFDYAILGKPIVIFAYDWQEYKATRGTYFDITTDAPGVVAHTLDELNDVIRTQAYLSDESIERLAKFKEIFCPFDDGRATERVLQKVFLRQDVKFPTTGTRSVPSPQSLKLPFRQSATK